MQINEAQIKSFVHPLKKTTENIDNAHAQARPKGESKFEGFLGGLYKVPLSVSLVVRLDKA